MPGILSADGNRQGMINNSIPIGFAPSIVAGVETRIDLLAHSDDDGLRQEAVERFLEYCFIQPGITSKIGDLAKSMNASVRSAGTDNRHSFSDDICDGFFYFRLNGPIAFLALPAMKAAAVVFNGNFKIF